MHKKGHSKTNQMSYKNNTFSNRENHSVCLYVKFFLIVANIQPTDIETIDHKKLQKQ